MSRGYRQYEVAKWLEIPDHSLSEYLTCRSHPSEDREEKLLRLGGDLRRLRRAILADKISFWIEKLDLTVDDAGGALRQVDAELHRDTDGRTA
jgi:predicted transcriptional regulator